nr:hypothetical protein GCM10020092_050990 [Actinoplanes digitatis]
MTAANERLHGVPARTALPPGILARLVLWTVVGVNVLIVETVFLTAEPAKNAILGFGKWLGLHLALIMILQLILVARLPWLDRRIGMDRLTSWHRWTGFTLFWLVLLHPTFILLGYASEYNSTPLTEFNNLKGQMPVLLGMLAAGIVLVAAGLSVRAARRRLSYEAWHAVHVCLYVAVVFGLIHQLTEVSTFTSSAFARAYWWGGCGRSRWCRWSSAGWSCRCGATPATSSGSPRWCPRPTTWCRCTSRAATWTSC